MSSDSEIPYGDSIVSNGELILAENTDSHPTTTVLSSGNKHKRLPLLYSNPFAEALVGPTSVFGRLRLVPFPNCELV